LQSCTREGFKKKGKPLEIEKKKRTDGNSNKGTKKNEMIHGVRFVI